MKNIWIKLILLAAFLMPFPAYTAEQIPVDPLSLYARTVWPEDVKTVEEAVRYLLEPTGYILVTGYPAPFDAADLVKQPIPPIAKLHRTMPIIDALQIMIGLDNYVVVDHANRLVSFSGSK